MQSIIVIPELSARRKYVDDDGVLTRKIAGVPLLARIVLTAARAGADSFLLVWPAEADRTIWNGLSGYSSLQGLRITHLVRRFDPRLPASWAALGDALEDRFLWLPWNWVTHKRALAGLTPMAVRPGAWHAPVLVEKRAAICCAKTQLAPGPVEGVPITPQGSGAAAERFLVAHSGKPTDGIYSRFNRLLCRPAVRLLTHTRVTPNWVTVGGLAVGIVAALMYARGYYAAYVAGALLFFLSGLFDEMDGMLARITFRESVFGTWFEGFVDEATYLLVFSGITAGLYRQRGPRELTYGYLLIAGCVLSVIVTRLQRRKAAAPDRPQEYAGNLNQLLERDSSNLISRVVRQIHIFIKKGVAIHYLVIFTVLGGLPLLLRLAAVGANLTWMVTLYFNRRFFRRPKAGAGVEAARAAWEAQ
jgi:phosphatidylglycerophosphate synthase